MTSGRLYYPFPSGYEPKEHTFNTTCVLHYLCEESEENGKFAVSKRAIADYIGINKTMVDKIFKRLEKEGFIKITSSSSGRKGTKGVLICRNEAYKINKNRRNDNTESNVEKIHIPLDIGSIGVQLERLNGKENGG